tara:strand:- start:120 stop:524 length:405 start_codon:yes stop_codon:yes gene_type:complete
MMAELTDQDRDEMRELIEQKWVAGGLARDWEASMALCTEDFVYMPQDNPVLHGKAEAQGWLDGFPDLKTFSQEVVDISGDRELAVLRCTFKVGFEADGQEVSGVGKGLAAMSRQSGEWLMSAVCFNWDTPLFPA